MVALLCISSVAASEDNICDDNLTADSSSLELEIDDESGELTASGDSALSEPQTVVVDNVGENHNEMNEHTIRNAIKSANDGDTILIDGQYYAHVHLQIDKKLNIVSNVGTTMEPCGSTAFSGFQGMLYLTSGASGSVIEGFNFVNDGTAQFSDNGDYGIFIDGASNVTIRNCTFSNEGYGAAIRVNNAQNTLITNVSIGNANNGIWITDSNQTRVEYSFIDNNKVAGVAIAGFSCNSTIIHNNITNNKQYGIDLTSSDNINILSNYIADNSKYGVYVNCYVKRIVINGNFFKLNGLGEVYNTDEAKNVWTKGGEKLEEINNNYMIGVGERAVYRSFSGGVFLGYVFEINENVNCPVIYFTYGPTQWSLSGNYELQLSEITQVKKGVYSISIVDENGTIASDLSSVPVTFYLNKVGKSATPQSGDVYKTVMMKNGTATVRFAADDFNESGNVVTAVFPTPGANIDDKVSRTLTIEDSSIPGNLSNTSIIVSDLNTYPNSNQEFIATLFDENNNFVVGETLTFKLDGETFNVTTDSNGQAKINVSIANEGNYTIDVNYFSDGIEYYSSSAQASVIVKKQTVNTSISVSDLSTYPNSNQEFIATLLDENNNPIEGQTLTFNVNKEIFNVTTDDKGQAKINVSISKEGTYTIEVNYFSDESDYYASNAQAKVSVKKQATKITSSNVYMIPKMGEYYSITLKDDSGKAIANQKITFKVNGKTYTKTTNSKGVAKVSLKFSSQKTYQIVTKFAGSNKFKATSNTNKITVKYSSKTAKLTAPSVTIAPKTSKTYTVTLKDANNKGISKQKVTIKVNGKTYTKTTNSKGQASVKVKFSSLKTYKVSASYKGSKVYKKTSATGKIKVAKTVTKITAPKVSALPKESKTYTVTLKTSAGKALSKQKVTIKVNGKTYTKTTNSKGQASVKVNLASEKAYSVAVNYKGTAIYKASKATGKITVSKLKTELIMYDRTFSKDAQIDYQITLEDASGKAISGQNIKYSINGVNYAQTTDSNGKVKLDFANQTGDSFDVAASYAGTAKYKAASKTAKITISNKTDVIFVDGSLPNSEIQSILNSAPDGSNVEVLGDYYFDIALNINKPLNIYSNDKTILNAKSNNPTLTIKASNVNITNLIVVGNSGDSIVINNAKDIVIYNNSVSNNLDESKIPSYVDGSVMIPGRGVTISNSTNVKLSNNYIESFESGLFAEYSSGISIDNNTFRENNYGITYGFGVANTEIINNEIVDCVGLYIMTVPEGPTGYGIYLNNSAVNVTINKNHIYNNFIGISLDANYSTGIVITQNTITDQILEGIRFNAGYDLAENAVEPVVTDNAIYRNARGPSMMILGEMSANPFGIYGPGQWNDSLRLKVAPNWYGTNQLVTWDNDTGYVGYGTMCPRISTSEIKFNEITYENGSYDVVFYKNGVQASSLPEFDLFATLNWGANNAVEVNFNVINGVGSFSFNSSDYNADNNTISITVASLIDSTSRVPKIIYSYDVPESEIKA